MTTYSVPDQPADPETAALEMIVRLPADILGSTAFTTVLQDYCGVLHAENCFAGLTWVDAKQVASCRPTAGWPSHLPTRSDASERRPARPLRLPAAQ